MATHISTPTTTPTPTPTATPTATPTSASAAPAGQAAPAAPLLTRRQWEVVRLVGEGYSNEEIAAALGLSVDGVESHLRNVARSLGITGSKGRRRRVATAAGCVDGAPHPADLLTARQWQVARLIRQGYSNPQIAARLFLSVDSVKAHVRNIARSLGITGRDGAGRDGVRIRIATELGFTRADHYDPAAPPPLRRALTPRERAVLRLVAANLSNQDIAQQLNMAVNTVGSHLRRISHALGHPDGYGTRLHLVRLGISHGYLPNPANPAKPAPSFLSKVDRRLVELLADRHTMADIRRVLGGVTVAALNTHLATIRAEFDLPATAGRADIVAAARAHGLVP